MSIQDLGAIGELLSSLFVLITLVYLAVQVRHSRELLEENRKITLSQVYEGRANLRAGQARSMVSNPHWAAVWVKLQGGDPYQSADVLIENFDRLADEEKALVIFNQNATTQGIDNTLYQVELGLVDEAGAQGSYDFIKDQYPLWVHSRIRIPVRITNWYEDNVEKETGLTQS